MPRFANVWVVESFVREEATVKLVNLFQVTVGSTKIEDARALNKKLRKMAMSGKTPPLLFLVPPDIYEDFKVVGVKGNSPPHARHKLAKGTHLYVMKGVCL
ncbi:hypothetical protein GPECTOR_8g98 [Gonium pectorale]|uniref:Uncharacterized protein n=1 Tax=Gonium pectorale TaxID=33097 RepID=A0A150GTU5_GONPE|nr:hypothetical protein GPECTOR_8g98 [Gonium pectorale]|eukprot:KXZ53108.1 hypothetical protein GPECTOR_8g98 [Gonium pectorale]